MVRNLIAAGVGFITPLVIGLNIYGAVVIGTRINSFNLPPEAYWGGFWMFFVLAIGAICIAAVIIG